MDLSAINPVLLIASLMVAATPLLLAAIGELVVEKAGVLNLGVEGMMIVGAISGFAISVETGSPFLGLIAAIATGHRVIEPPMRGAREYMNRMALAFFFETIAKTPDMGE